MPYRTPKTYLEEMEMYAEWIWSNFGAHKGTEKEYIIRANQLGSICRKAGDYLFLIELRGELPRQEPYQIPPWLCKEFADAVPVARDPDDDAVP